MTQSNNEAERREQKLSFVEKVFFFPSLVAASMYFTWFEQKISSLILLYHRIECLNAFSMIYMQIRI